MMQSLEVGPVHVWHSDEQTEQEAPLGKLPSGQSWFVVVTACTGLHFVGSEGLWLKPEAHEVHWPVQSEHCVHPI